MLLLLLRETDRLTREKTTSEAQINPKENQIKSKNCKTNSKRKITILDEFRNLNGLNRSSNGLSKDTGFGRLNLHEMMNYRIFQNFRIIFLKEKAFIAPA